MAANNVFEGRAPLKYERLDFYERYCGYFDGLEEGFLGFLMGVDFVFEVLDEYGPIPWLRRAIIGRIREGARRLRARCYNDWQRRIVREAERYFCDEVERIYGSWLWRVKSALGRVPRAVKRVIGSLRGLREEARRSYSEAASDIANLVYLVLGLMGVRPARRTAIAGAAYKVAYHALTILDSLMWQAPILIIAAGLALYYHLLFSGAVMA